MSWTRTVPASYTTTHDVAWLLGHVNDGIALLNEEGA
jgi:hypothetical protein